MKVDDLLFSLPLSCVVVDKEGRILTANQKFETAINRSLKFIKGKVVWEVVGSKRLKEKIEESLRDTKEILGLTERGFCFFISPLFVSSQVKGAVILVQQIDTSFFGYSIDALFKVVAHEIRNPLTGIKTAVEFLLSTNSCDLELLRAIKEEVERLSRLLKDMGSALGEGTPNYKNVNLHKILNRITEIFSKELKKNRISLQTSYDPSLPEILGDEDKLAQAFVNIFKNSIEAVLHSERKEITIETGYAIEPSGFVFVSFEDSGEGVKEPFDSFKPFSSTKNSLGVGMFIAERIIKAHGGSVKMEKGRTGGAKITVLLPMRRA